MKPTQPPRQHLPDTIRGIALLGIALVNAPFLGISLQGITAQAIQTPWDTAVAYLIVAFCQAKFYLLFAFLFGYSSTFIVRPNAAADEDSKRRFRRRLFGLAALGALHGLFFFIGDILMVYAVMGLGLLWLFHKSDAVAYRTATIAFAVWALLLLSVLALSLIEPSSQSELDFITAYDSAMRTGGWLSAIEIRAQTLPFSIGVIGLLNGLSALACFSLGLVAGRKRLLSQVDAYPRLWRLGSRVGLIVGLPCGLLSAWLVIGADAAQSVRATVGILIGFITAPALTFGYLAWLVQWYESIQSTSRVVQWFAQPGRMSLTGYIGESALMSMVFCGYGLGWFGTLGVASVSFIAVVSWLLIKLLSLVWLRYFEQGPLESLLARWSKAI
jgi:uncharacterized protein